MTWEEYYEKIWEWAPSTMVSRMSKLTSFGDPEEVMEVIIEISFGDEKGATRLLRKATDAGVKFSGEQFAELSGCCEEGELIRAIRFSCDKFQDIDIENLYLCFDEELVVEIAKKRNLKLPVELLEEDDDLEEMDEVFSKEEIIESYDYVLQCLKAAHEKMILAYRLSISDVGSDKRGISILKHACLLEAEPFIDAARAALEEMESQVADTISIQNTRLNLGKWIGFHDVYGDGFLTDWMVQRRIKKMIEALEVAHKEIKKIRDTLR